MNTFKTISEESEGLFKDRGSKFIGIACPVQSEEDFKAFQQRIKKKYHDARHHCYAFRMGHEGKLYRYSDDGEPSSSAGKPIYGQLLSHEITNVAIIVVRYFGGTKLGVGGLINAYREGAKEALQNNDIITKEIFVEVIFNFGYDHMNAVMNATKTYNLDILDQQFTDSCMLKAHCPLSQLEAMTNKFELIHEVELKVK